MDNRRAGGIRWHPEFAGAIDHRLSEIEQVRRTTARHCRHGVLQGLRDLHNDPDGREQVARLIEGLGGAPSSCADPGHSALDLRRRIRHRAHDVCERHGRLEEFSRDAGRNRDDERSGLDARGDVGDETPDVLRLHDEDHHIGASTGRDRLLDEHPESFDELGSPLGPLLGDDNGRRRRQPPLETDDEGLTHDPAAEHRNPGHVRTSISQAPGRSTRTADARPLGRFANPPTSRPNHSGPKGTNTRTCSPASTSRC